MSKEKSWVIETDLKQVQGKRVGVREVEDAARLGRELGSGGWVSGIEGEITPGMVEKSELLQRLESALDRDGLTFEDLGKGRKSPTAVRREFLRMKSEEEDRLRGRGVLGSGSRQAYVGLIWDGQPVFEDRALFLEDFNYFPQGEVENPSLPVLERQRTLRVLCWARNAVALSKVYRTFSRPFVDEGSRETRLIVAWEGSVILGAGGLHTSADHVVGQGIQTIDAAIESLQEKQRLAGVGVSIPPPDPNLGVN